jgi:hypothetical protein
MSRVAQAQSLSKDSAATIGFKVKYWLAAERHAQFDGSAELEAQIKGNLEGLGYGL